MNYKDWETEILRENSVEKIIEQFRLSADQVWYFDRHIIDSIDDLPELEDADNFWSVCDAALALLEQWRNYVFELTNTDILASEPYLVIDDEWLERQQNSPPPHVYLTLAKQSKYLKPDFFFHATKETDSKYNEFRNWLMGKGNWKVRIKNPDEEYGCWIIMF
ncbi:MAG: hypothetical protein R2747_14745 [Pyrinomonadaceae bacterium]